MGSHLKSISPAIDRLKRVKEIHLQHNLLESFPSISLPELRYLFLSDNKLREVGQLKCKKLEWL